MSLMNTLFGGSESSATNNSGGMNTGMNQSYTNGLNVNYGTNSSGNSSSSANNQRIWGEQAPFLQDVYGCLLYTSPSPRDATLSRMPSSA